MSVTSPIKDTEQIAKIKMFFMKRGRLRDYALFTVGINTALRIGDILDLTWGDVYDFAHGVFRSHLEVHEHKTGKRNCVLLNDSIVEALTRLLDQSNADAGDFIFKSRKGKNRHITRSRAYSIFINAASELEGVDKFSCHSLRKTFGYHAMKAGASGVLLMEVFNHSSFNITKRYLGIEQQEKDQLYGKVQL
ncbi:MAG: tyrosine-type recombinase/integrase [Treponema sp.]|nr:tyrosine-type recombinase/integrase [Treponema sp.]